MRSRRIITIVIVTLLLLQGFAMGAGAEGDHVTGIQVQNQSEEDVNIEIQFYWATGTANAGQPALDPVFTDTIEGNKANQYHVPDAFPELPDGFVGSAVVTADGPIAAILNTVSGSGAEEDPFAFGAATGIGGGGTAGGLEPALDVYAPYVRKDYYGYTSYLAVQNTADTEAEVTVRYMNLDGEWVAAAEETATISPYSTHIFDQGDNEDLVGRWPEIGFGGSAVISSDQPVAVVVNIPHATEPRLESYNGFASGSKEWYLPKLDLEYYNYNSGISAQNMSEVTATMNITFTINEQEYSKTSDPIGPGQTWQIYMPNEATTGLPADLTGVTGCAILTSDQDVVVTVSNLNEEEGHDFLYNGAASETATSTVLFPKFDKNFTPDVWVGGIQVQNLGDTTTDLIATFSGGGLTSDVSITRYDVAPGASAYWFNPSELPDGFNGSVTVVSESGGDIVGVYTGRNDNMVGDTVGCYEGMQK